jgi:hypothetical protein
MPVFFHSYPLVKLQLRSPFVAVIKSNVSITDTFMTDCLPLSHSKPAALFENGFRPESPATLK